MSSRCSITASSAICSRKLRPESEITASPRRLRNGWRSRPARSPDRVWRVNATEFFPGVGNGAVRIARCRASSAWPSRSPRRTTVQCQRQRCAVWMRGQPALRACQRTSLRAAAAARMCPPGSLHWRSRHRQAPPRLPPRSPRSPARRHRPTQQGRIAQPCGTSSPALLIRFGMRRLRSDAAYHGFAACCHARGKGSSLR